jgi:hypothetical protein
MTTISSLPLGVPASVSVSVSASVSEASDESDSISVSYSLSEMAPGPRSPGSLAEFCPLSTASSPSKYSFYF